MNEEILDALSSIVDALDIFKPVNPWEELLTFWTDKGRVIILWNQHQRVYLHKFIEETKSFKPEKVVELTVLENKNEAVLKAGLVYFKRRRDELTTEALDIAESI